MSRDALHNWLTACRPKERASQRCWSEIVFQRSQSVSLSKRDTENANSVIITQHLHLLSVIKNNTSFKDSHKSSSWDLLQVRNRLKCKSPEIMTPALELINLFNFFSSQLSQNYSFMNSMNPFLFVFIYIKRSFFLLYIFLALLEKLRVKVIWWAFSMWNQGGGAQGL